MLAPDSAFSDAVDALCAGLAETRAREAEVTHKVTLPDPWRRAVFIALGRRYGLHLRRHAGQRRQTLRVCVPPSFFSRVLWPEFEKITDLLMYRFDAITQEVLRAIAPASEDPRHLVIDGHLGAERDD